MRLWHKDLISVLPRKQLLGQWRECCLIAKNIAENGTPNHILVNKIMDYALNDFYSYGVYVSQEMEKRGYTCNFSKFEKWFTTYPQFTQPIDNIFKKWHNERYLLQCGYNLQEKHDCGGISEKEWNLITSQLMILTLPKELMDFKVKLDLSKSNDYTVINSEIYHTK